MPVALSSETLVNIVTAGIQSARDLAVNGDGVAAVAWADSASAASSVAKLRLIGPDGAPLGQEVSLGPAGHVQVAALADGGFVAVTIQVAGLVRTVKAQMFDAAGVARGEAKVLQHDEYPPNTPTLGVSAYDLEVVGLSDGGFAATFTASRWDSMGFTYRNVEVLVADSQGRVEGERSISISGEKDAGDPRPTLAQLPDGSVLVTWTPDFQPTQPTQQAAQLFDAQGAAKGGVFHLAGAYPTGLVVLDGGDVAAAWASGDVVYVAVYSGAALAQGAWTAVSGPQAVGATGFGAKPELAALADGGFAVSWSTGGQLDARDVMARVFSANGVPAGEAFRLGDISAGAQAGASVEGLPGGGLIAVWSDNSGLGGDASPGAVKAQVIWPAGGAAQPGTAAGDSMVGGAGADVFAGLEGADTLRGGGGADTLAGGPGGDVFVLATDGSVDRILDFSGASGDRLDLRDAAGAVVQEGLLILDATTGLLSWDRDGSGEAAQPLAIGRVAADGLDRDDFADGVRVAVRVQLEGGGRTDTVFDWGQAAYDQATATYDAENRVTTYFVRNDDGATGQRWWDVQATQPWTTRAAEYDASGKVKAYAVTYEDGHTEVFQFDVTNTQTWSRVVDFYDALGRHMVQAAAWDDGTAFERHHDTYDVHPWAYYIDNYKDGALLNHTFYNADGSVFVG